MVIKHENKKKIKQGSFLFITIKLINRRSQEATGLEDKLQCLNTEMKYLNTNRVSSPFEY